MAEPNFEQLHHIAVEAEALLQDGKWTPDEYARLLQQAEEAAGEDQQAVEFLLNMHPVDLGTVLKSNPYHDKSGLFASKDHAINVEDDGTYVTFTIPDGAGKLVTSRKPDGLQIREAFVKEEHRGRGLGVALYSKALEFAHGNGMDLRSDEATSVSADHVWQALGRRGHTVERQESELDTSLNKFYAVKDLVLPGLQPLKVRSGKPVWRAPVKKTDAIDCKLVQVLKANPYHDENGRFTSQAHAFQGLTALSIRKNQVRHVLPNKSAVVKMSVQERDGELHVEYRHGFFSNDIAQRNLRWVKALYYGQNVQIEQKNSWVIVRTVLPKKADGLAKPTVPSRQVEESLRTSEMRDKNSLGGGVSTTFVLTLDNGTPEGSKAVFKPHEGEYNDRLRWNVEPGYQTEREVGAWEVAKLVGMDDLVMPTVERTIGGKRGSVQAFSSGKLARGVPQEEKYDGDRDALRTAMFDYVVGNTDRHGGNWLLHQGKLRLIDHGLCFPDLDGQIGGNTSFTRQAPTVGGRTQMKVEEFAAPYLKNREAIVMALGSTGLSSSAVALTAKRIDALKNLTTWEQIEKIVGGYGR